MVKKAEMRLPNVQQASNSYRNTKGEDTGGLPFLNHWQHENAIYTRTFYQSLGGQDTITNMVAQICGMPRDLAFSAWD